MITLKQWNHKYIINYKWSCKNVHWKYWWQNLFRFMLCCIRWCELHTRWSRWREIIRFWRTLWALIIVTILNQTQRTHLKWTGMEGHLEDTYVKVTSRFDTKSFSYKSFRCLSKLFCSTEAYRKTYQKLSDADKDVISFVLAMTHLKKKKRNWFVSCHKLPTLLDLTMLRCSLYRLWNLVKEHSTTYGTDWRCSIAKLCLWSRLEVHHIKIVELFTKYN